MIIEQLRREIQKYDIPDNRINYQQFFKEKLAEPTGLKGGVLKDISNRCFKEVKKDSKDKILKLCDELLSTGDRYFRFFAFDWASRFKGKYDKKDFTRFERWLKTYVDDWGACDSLCTRPIGFMVTQYPELARRTKKWAISKNRWERRAAAVSLIVPVRNGLLLKDVFRTADILLTDKDDMVQKGYGWMLKVAADKFPDDVFDYVMKNKAKMPRTALRYAIEKYPEEKRREAMAKE
jgi:3-methyladenine DNA glycosylase AlkD